MMAANCSMPNIPRLEIVKVPLSKSVGFSLLSRACKSPHHFLASITIILHAILLSGDKPRATLQSDLIEFASLSIMRRL